MKQLKILKKTIKKIKKGKDIIKKPKIIIKKSTAELVNIQVDIKTKNEIERLIRKYKKERRIILQPHDIIYGYIKMTKYYMMHQEYECILFKEMIS